MGFLGVGLGLLVLAVIGVAAAASGRGNTQQLAPGSPGAQLPPAQAPVPIPVPGQVPVPGMPPAQPPIAPPMTAAEALLFDQTPQGVLVFKLALVQQLLVMLDQYAVLPVGGDESVVELVPRTNPAWASARQWCEKWNVSYTVLGCRWLSLPVQVKRFLRAVQPGSEPQWATTTSIYAVLGYPKTLGIQQPYGQPAAPPVAPVPGGIPLPQVPGIPGGVPLPQVPGVPGGIPLPQVPPGMPVAPAPQTFPPAPAADAFSSLPPQLQAEARKTYAEAKNPEALELVATQLDKAGYPDAGEAMRKRAAELRATQGVKQAASGKMHLLREGDTGSYLALWYTGTAGRWTELPSVNPGMRVEKVDGVTQLVPWKVGTYINLPPDWNTARGVPPTQRSVQAAQAALKPKPDTAKKG